MRKLLLFCFSFLTEKIKARPDPTDENAAERERQIKVLYNIVLSLE